MKVRANQNDTISDLCYRHLGVATGAVEQTLKLNPGIADYGAILPHGLLVELPEITTDAEQTADTVQLWD